MYEKESEEITLEDIIYSNYRGNPPLQDLIIILAKEVKELKDAQKQKT